MVGSVYVKLKSKQIIQNETIAYCYNISLKSQTY